MAYDTDEEQIEALQNWWKENGTSLIAGVVIVLAVLFGSRYWQSSQTENAEAASDLYQQMAGFVSGSTGQAALGEGELENVREIHRALREDFDDSIYSRYSSLLMARLEVEAGNLESAAAELQWIIDNPDLGFFQRIDEELGMTARARLARVQLALEEPQQALDTLAAVEPGPFEGLFAEIRGDAYLALGQEEEARSAYQQALDLGASPEIVQLKLNSLDS